MDLKIIWGRSMQDDSHFDFKQHSLKSKGYIQLV